MTFIKGHPRYGGMKNNQKTYKTIQKEKAREVFEGAQLKRWLEISEAQANDAVKDFNARKYSIDQTIGKAKETVEVQGIEFNFDEKTS